MISLYEPSYHPIMLWGVITSFPFIEVEFQKVEYTNAMGWRRGCEWDWLISEALARRQAVLLEQVVELCGAAGKAKSLQAGKVTAYTDENRFRALTLRRSQWHETARNMKRDGLNSPFYGPKDPKYLLHWVIQHSAGFFCALKNKLTKN